MSDIIDIVKHKDKHIRLGWTEGEDGYLKDEQEQSFKFYLRIKGLPNGLEDMQIIKLDKPEYKDEFALITPMMTGKEFEAFCKKFNTDDILGMLRLVSE